MELDRFLHAYMRVRVRVCMCGYPFMFECVRVCVLQFGRLHADRIRVDIKKVSLTTNTTATSRTINSKNV